MLTIPIFIKGTLPDIELTDKDLMIIGISMVIGGILSFILGWYLHQGF
jgi:hypothetical protein